MPNADAPKVPPIPPNAEKHFALINRMCFLVPASPSYGNTAIELESADEHWRPIIASVAAQYWWKEADCFDMDKEPDDEWERYEECKAKVDAWLRWGGLA